MENALVNKERNMEEMIGQKVEQYLHEQKEKEDRRCNLIFHNLPESEEEEIECRKSHDIQQVNSILSELEVEFTEIKQPTRLGKRATTQEGRAKPRLLRVTLGSTSTRKQALQKAKSLKTSQSEGWNKVYITPDLTYSERQENRKLRAELAARREKDSNLVIRNGRIVKAPPGQSFRGTPPEGGDRGAAAE